MTTPDINDMLEASRNKGWALAKSLQTQVDILLPVVERFVRVWKDPEAIEALEQLRKHRES